MLPLDNYNSASGARNEHSRFDVGGRPGRVRAAQCTRAGSGRQDRRAFRSGVRIAALFVSTPWCRIPTWRTMPLNDTSVGQAIVLCRLPTLPAGGRPQKCDGLPHQSEQYWTWRRWRSRSSAFPGATAAASAIGVSPSRSVGPSAPGAARRMRRVAASRGLIGGAA